MDRVSEVCVVTGDLSAGVDCSGNDGLNGVADDIEIRIVSELVAHERADTGCVRVIVIAGDGAIRVDGESPSARPESDLRVRIVDDGVIAAGVTNESVHPGRVLKTTDDASAVVNLPWLSEGRASWFDER